MTDAQLRTLYQEYEKQSREELSEIAQKRKGAHGILQIDTIGRKVDKGQGIVLAYGANSEIRFSPEELRQFLDTIERTRKRINRRHSAQGIPRDALLRASRPADKARAKTVRNATLYQRAGNILYFKVTGNARPFYRVQIRLEEWNAYITDRTPALKAIKNILAGRMSIECPCGRHQYWYRYLATLGKYCIAPQERGFPKIRNPKLGGCCCKHVLKVLHDLKTSRFMLILAKEMDKERNKTGFSNARKVILTAADLRIAQSKRMSRSAMALFRKYEEEEKRIKPNVKIQPAKVTKQKPVKITRDIANDIKAVVRLSQAMRVKLNTLLDGVAKTHNISREAVEAYIKEHNLVKEGK